VQNYSMKAGWDGRFGAVTRSIPGGGREVMSGFRKNA
jgi:hypothetical protein